MILEEVMNISSNTIINISEVTCPLDDYLDLVCEQCNDILLEAESDFKINKTDLSDPAKLKQFLNKLEKDNITPPDKKLKILFKILDFVIFVLLVGSTITLSIFNSIIAATITLISAILLLIPLVRFNTYCDNYKRISNKIDGKIKIIKRKINKESDPDKKKELETKCKELSKIKTIIDDEWNRVHLEVQHKGLLKKPSDGKYITKRHGNDFDEEYIERLKKNISMEKDPERKQKLKDHFKYIKYNYPYFFR